MPIVGVPSVEVGGAPGVGCWYAESGWWVGRKQISYYPSGFGVVEAVISGATLIRSGQQQP
ncbi:MAG: hypothetical protein HOI07_09950 [Betaproteobacteria bacterium]|nr:hypothetical protein [Betaproteobacteria bacterium]